MASSSSSSQKGFTLLELIVVIVILGVLAAIAIPTFQSVIGKSKVAVLSESASALDHDALSLAGLASTTSDQIDPSSASGGTFVQTAAAELSGVSVIPVDSLHYTLQNAAGTTVCLTVSGAPNRSGQVTPSGCTGTAYPVLSEGFESGANGWGSGTNMSASVVSSTSHSGSSSMLMTRTSSTGGNGYLSKSVPCTPNTTYTMKVWIKAGTGTGPLNLVIAEQQNQNIRGASTFTPTTSWAQYSLTYTTTSGVSPNCSFYAIADDPVAAPASGQTYYVDDITITHP